VSVYLGLAVLDALLLAAGLGLLYGLGLVRSSRDALRHAGVALFTGWAAVGTAITGALVAGAPLHRWLVASLALALAGGGLALGRRVPAVRLPVLGERGSAVWAAVAGSAVVAIQLAALLRRALTPSAPLEWDAWDFWLPKAKALVEFGGLDTGAGGFTSFAHATYPPLVPALEGSAFSFMGTTDASPLALQHWLVAVAFVAGLASLLAARVRPAILWPSLALLASLPTFGVLVGSSLGDEPLMLLLGASAACAALWLIEPRAPLAALAGIFLAAAALAKQEGLPLALVLAGTLLLVSWRRPLAPALLLLAPIAAVLPWKLWVRLNDVPASPDYRLTDLLDTSLLADRLDRLSYAADKLPGYVFEPGRWLIAVPLMLAAAVLAAPRRPSLSVLALVPVVAVPLGLLVAYWIGYPPVDWYVATSAARGVASGVVVAAVFLPVLLAEASRP
jgi:hypothetical protein